MTELNFNNIKNNYNSFNCDYTDVVCYNYEYTHQVRFLLKCGERESLFTKWCDIIIFRTNNHSKYILVTLSLSSTFTCFV